MSPAQSHDLQFLIRLGESRDQGVRIPDPQARVIATGTKPSGRPPDGCEYMAVDFTDAKKRRVLGEWTLEVRNPEAQFYGSAKT